MSPEEEHNILRCCVMSPFCRIFLKALTVVGRDGGAGGRWSEVRTRSGRQVLAQTLATRTAADTAWRHGRGQRGHTELLITRTVLSLLFGPPEDGVRGPVVISHDARDQAIRCTCAGMGVCHPSGHGGMLVPGSAPHLSDWASRARPWPARSPRGSHVAPRLRTA